MTADAPHTSSAGAAEETSLLRRTAAWSRHVASGAKLADFGGWHMPIEYPDGGVLREHEAVRERVGVFDVSHLGKVSVRGPGAAAFVNSCLTNDLDRIGPGEAQYTMCCNDTGGVVDDLIAYLRSPDDVFLVPNAANTAQVARRLRAAAPSGVAVEDVHDDFGVIAVQGPRSDDVLVSLGLPAGHPYMTFVEARFAGWPVIVCRTGYTGERGYELVPAAVATPALWDAAVAAARALGGLPAGLGARDTLRTEMGYALHGHELTPEISPVQARTGWAVGWKKAAFWGRDALLAERAAASSPLLRGLVAVQRGIPRAEMKVTSLDGASVGRTTSGTFSPTLKQGIGLALLERAVVVGDEVEVQVRGRALRCRVVAPPFVESHTA